MPCACCGSAAERGPTCVARPAKVGLENSQIAAALPLPRAPSCGEGGGGTFSFRALFLSRSWRLRSASRPPGSRARVRASVLPCFCLRARAASRPDHVAGSRGSGGRPGERQEAGCSICFERASGGGQGRRNGRGTLPGPCRAVRSRPRVGRPGSRYDPFPAVVSSLCTASRASVSAQTGLCQHRIQSGPLTEVLSI